MAEAHQNTLSVAQTANAYLFMSSVMNEAVRDRGGGL